MAEGMDEGGDPAANPVDGVGDGDRRFYARLGAVVLLLGLGYLVWRIVTPLWQPLAWAALLGALLAPLNLRLAARLGGRQRLASALTLAATVLGFILPVAAITGAVAAEATQLLRRLDTGLPQLRQALAFDVSRLPWLARALDRLEASTGVSLNQLRDWLVEGTRHLLQSLAASGGSFVVGALGTVASFALMLFVLFFVLRDGPSIANRVVAMLPIEEHRRTRLWEHLVEVTRAVFLGIGVTALAQGVLVGFGFWIAGLASPLLFGVLAVLLSLVPMVGAALVWLPGVLLLAARGDYGHAIFLAAWGVIVVGMADNVLRPLLISGRAAVPTLAVFVGVMGGLAAFGFVGLFLGPIVLGLLVALFRYESERLAGAAADH